MIYSDTSSLLGSGQASAALIQAWFTAHGTPPAALGDSILSVCTSAGVNGDLVAAQVAHETGYWGSQIAQTKNNPAGLGADNANPLADAVTFSTPHDGIVAQVAHLLTYVLGAANPWQAQDPRYSATTTSDMFGHARVLHDLDQHWAWSPQATYDATPAAQRYGARIAALANELLSFSGQTVSNQSGGSVGTIPDHVDTLGNLPVVQTPAAAGNYDGTWVEADYLIQHVEQAHTADSAVGRFQTPGQEASTTLVYDPAKRRFDEVTGLRDTSYGAGNYRINQRSWQMEAPYFIGDQIPDQTIEDVAQAWASLCRLAGIPAERLTKADMIAGTKRGLIGHEDVPNPNIPVAQLNLSNPSHWGGADNHTDPGSTWPWDRIMARIVDLLGNPPHPVVVPETLSFSTGFNVAGGFARYWQKWGALAVFGLPLDGEHPDDSGLTVQNFERSRFEWHTGIDPDNWDVLLGRVGYERAQQLGYIGTHPAFADAAQNGYGDPNAVYDGTTKHNLSHGFHAYWDKFGGLAVFGRPLSEEFEENGVTVQYFERARFEWHDKAWPDRFDVLLGRVVAEAQGK